MFGAKGRIHDDHFKLVVPAPVTQRTDVRIDQVNVVNFEICTENKFSQSGALKQQPTCNILLELLQSVGVYIEARDGAGPEHDAADGEHPAPAPEVRHKPVLDVVEGGGDGVQHAGGNVRPGGVLLCERRGNISFINAWLGQILPHQVKFSGSRTPRFVVNTVQVASTSWVPCSLLRFGLQTRDDGQDDVTEGGVLVDEEAEAGLVSRLQGSLALARGQMASSPGPLRRRGRGNLSFHLLDMQM